MYIDVIPYDMSFSTEALTYFVGDSFDTDILIWQLVIIPFWKKDIYWIIADISLTPRVDNPENIKEIASIVTSYPLLDRYQLSVIQKISLKYFLPIHKVLAIFLSRPLIKRLEKRNFLLEYIPYERSITTKKQYFCISLGSIIDTETITTLFENVESNIVLVVPDDLFLEQLKHNWKHVSTLFVGNEETDAMKSKKWIEVYEKKYQIIIWTRRILYYNLSWYDEIFYFEDAFSEEYYHHPIRISYTDILAYIADTNTFSIEILSSAPKLKTLKDFHFFQFHQFTHVTEIWHISQ